MRSVSFFVVTMFLSMSPTEVHAEKLVLVAGGKPDKLPATATNAKLNAPFGVDFDRQGNMFIVEMKGERIATVDPRGNLSVLAGTGEKGDSGDGGPAAKAQFNGAHNLVVAKNGDIYVADTWNNRIRKIDAVSQTITPFAGTGKKGFYGDGGPAMEAEFGGVYCIAFDPSEEHLYLADLDNHRIRAIDLATGIVTTIAGDGERGTPKDGSEATLSPLVDPRAVAADGHGNVYILERKGNALRVVDNAGMIRTVVGPGVEDTVDEHGSRPTAMKGPKHLCVDADGNVLIADSDNHQIRKYLPHEKKLITIAGIGKPGAAGLNGPPLAAHLNQPHGVTVDRSGVLFIADSSNNRVLKIVER